MLHVRYVHSPTLSSERMSRKDYDHNDSVAKRNLWSGASGGRHQDELISSKPPIVKKLWVGLSGLRERRTKVQYPLFYCIPSTLFQFQASKINLYLITSNTNKRPFVSNRIVCNSGSFVLLEMDLFQECTDIGTNEPSMCTVHTLWYGVWFPGLALWNPVSITIRTKKNTVFWAVALCGFIINRRLGGMCHLHLQGSNHLTLSLARVISSILKMEATRSSETSVYTKPTRRHIPEEGILHSHRSDNLKYY
jgi:hypothetical protein